MTFGQEKGWAGRTSEAGRGSVPHKKAEQTGAFKSCSDSHQARSTLLAKEPATRQALPEPRSPAGHGIGASSL